MSKPRLLFLCQCLPYPGDEGVKIRTFNILKRLAQDFEVRALCFFRRAAHHSPEQVEAAVQALSQYATVSAHAIPQETSRLRLLIDHTRSVLQQRVFTVFAYESASFRRDLQQALDTFRPDIVHMDSLDLSGYLPAIPRGLPVVCVHHNVESALLARRAQSARGFKRWYFGLQARLTMKEERRYLPQVALNVAVSDPDQQLLRQLVATAAYLTIPNGVDTTEISPLPDADAGIVFVGGASWFPNRDALEYFAAEILPRIRSRLPDVPVTWVGQASAADRAHYATTHGITLTGYVDRIEPWVQQAGCFVVPLRVGGGTRLKILYAWSMQRAIVSTSIGCEGLDGHDGQDILIRDTPEAFADAVVDVLTRPDRRQQLAAAGRRLAQSRYDWDVITADMNRHYLALLPKASR
ncbi:MAG: glycosyltransferase [Gemmatimonadaceae bacterium]|nr:glycosyltransferase [Gemmatimonadaceae bacterium]